MCVSARIYGLGIERSNKLPETQRICIIMATNKHHADGLLRNVADSASAISVFLSILMRFSIIMIIIKRDNFIRLKLIRVWTKRGDVQRAG